MMSVSVFASGTILGHFPIDAEGSDGSMQFGAIGHKFDTWTWDYEAVDYSLFANADYLVVHYTGAAPNRMYVTNEGWWPQVEVPFHRVADGLAVLTIADIQEELSWDMDRTDIGVDLNFVYFFRADGTHYTGVTFMSGGWEGAATATSAAAPAPAATGGDTPAPAANPRTGVVSSLATIIALFAVSGGSLVIAKKVRK
jgi:hypothetical protein